MVPTSSRETSLLFENNKVKSRLLSNASSSRFDGSFEATPTTRRGVSFPPPLARTQTTTEPDREMKK
jgi:hypothetical protein